MRVSTPHDTTAAPHNALREVAAFLVSDRNSYMNGATVVLDGAV